MSLILRPVTKQCNYMMQLIIDHFFYFLETVHRVGQSDDEGDQFMQKLIKKEGKHAKKSTYYI